MQIAPAALREARLRSGDTQASLAKKAGITRATVQNLERGRTQPVITTVKKLADALGVAVSEIADFKEAS